MLYATKEMILRDIEALPPDYKTKDIDALIRRYVKEQYDMSALRGEILTEQRLHRIYFYTSLKQLKSVSRIGGTPTSSSVLCRRSTMKQRGAIPKNTSKAPTCLCAAGAMCCGSPSSAATGRMWTSCCR